MTSLDQIVLPLAESRALAEKGIVLDTALVWVIPIGVMGLPLPYVAVSGDSINHHFKCVPAPVFSELLDAIRERVKPTCAETEVILGRDVSEAGASCAALRMDGGRVRNLSPAPTDLLAACALLLEVSK